jgi:hypothetical protein
MGHCFCLLKEKNLKQGIMYSVLFQSISRLVDEIRAAAANVILLYRSYNVKKVFCSTHVCSDELAKYQ